MRILRDQLGQWVYPVHRLDRATSGVLVFGLSSEAAQRLAQLFKERQVRKCYWAVVRGFIHSRGVIDYPLREEKHKPPASARTRYRRLGKVELPIPVGKFPTARYSLAEIIPETGRRNQIRKHFAHLSHPVIGDVSYGDGRHNRLFREQFNLHRLLLFALSLNFEHPFSHEQIFIEAPLPPEVIDLFNRFAWPLPESPTIAGE